jgi:hypothetical protein
LSTASVRRKQATTTCLPGFRAFCILERTEQLVNSQRQNRALLITSVLSLSIPEGTDQLFQPGFKASASLKGPSLIHSQFQRSLSIAGATEQQPLPLAINSDAKKESKSVQRVCQGTLGLPCLSRGKVFAFHKVTFASHKVGTNSTLSPTIHIAPSQQCCRAVGSTPRDTV